jgi:group I intron endonuclease
MDDKDYTQGKIYMIINLDTSMIYVGSTTIPLYRRWDIHKCSYKIERKKHRPICKAIEEYGADNFVIFLLENYSCENDEALRQREVYYQKIFDSLNNEVGYNVSKAHRTLEEKKEDKHNYNISRREQHREHLKEWRKRNAETQREKETLKMREWRSKNREKYNAYQREWRANHKDNIREAIKKQQKKRKTKI